MKRIPLGVLSQGKNTAFLIRNKIIEKGEIGSLSLNFSFFLDQIPTQKTEVPG